MIRATGFAAVAGLVVLLAGCAHQPATPEGSVRSYIVRLPAPPLAAYAGGIEGLAATSPAAAGAAAADPNSPASLAYLAYLEKQQAQVIARIADTLGHRVTPIFHYYYALDGFVLRLTPAEAARVAGLAGVAAVLPDTAYPELAPDGPRPTQH